MKRLIVLTALFAAFTASADCTPSKGNCPYQNEGGYGHQHRDKGFHLQKKTTISTRKCYPTESGTEICFDREYSFKKKY